MKHPPVSWAFSVALIATSANLSLAASPDLRRPPDGGAVMVYDRDYPFIHYSDPPVRNDIARLQQRIDSGSVTLTATPQHGYLESILKALNINPDSQTLVFSKTSLQVDAISAATPRAIYFNDDTYVAWVQKTGKLEIVTMDADRGPVFYTVSAADSRADLEREALRCLTCHDSYSEMGGGVPRFLFESTYEVRHGKLIPDAVARETADDTPFAERWGGWYVTGQDGGAPHLGNIKPPAANSPVAFDVVRRGSLASLDSLLDTSAYLRNTSDIVALLVLEHQVTVHNLIVRANFKSRMLLARLLPARDAATLHWAQLPPTVQTRLDQLLGPVVDGLALRNAAPLPDTVVASNGYAAWFQAQGPKDSHGRSLRELDLHSRVFRYPLSFLIYSEGFDALPLLVREHLYEKLAHTLRATPDGQTAFEILLATKREFSQEVKTLRD
ncbi:MAG TPA: hypothetical protein VK727_05150 [Steroidobacteraceae bacterium]|nr:hypothetical protein [Steroidobacteraceae bacterium]